MDHVVLPDAEAVAERAATMIADEITASSELSIGLAGGSTPRATLRLLAGAGLDWSGVTTWVPDERWVPPDHADANQSTMREDLVDRVGVEFVAPDTLLGNPSEAARRYGDIVIPLLTDRERRSVVMLGLGTDGHTASLFPGTTALEVHGNSYVANFVPQLDMWRLTATFDLIATADVVLFVVTGDGKAEAVAAISNGEDLPAARVTAREHVMWLLDRDAGSLL